MIETEISKINKRIWTLSIIKITGIELIIWPDLPSKESKRCPAIMFAERRIANVKGRIIKLIDSIITMKGIRIIGVPWGVKWANMSLIKFIILYIMILIQNERDRDKDNLKCLDAVKI